MIGISKRTLAFILSFVITIALMFSVPASAYAYEAEETANSEISEENIIETPEVIDDADDEPTQELVESEEIKDNSPITDTPVLRGTSAETVDFSALRKAFDKANSFLLSLDKKAAQYNITSVQALIDVLGNEDIATYLGADDLSGFDESDEENANIIAESISSAFSSLEQVSADCDLSSYEAAAYAINNLDSDAYIETKSLSSAIRIANILVKTTALTYTDVTDSQNTSSISAFKETATQRNIDDATRTILDALYVSVRSYTVTTSGAVVDASFQNGTSSGDNSPYTATYGSTVIAYSDIDDTAWYMEFSSDSTTRSRQFQGYGSSFRARVFGNMVIYAETRSTSAQNMVRIHRTYSNIPGSSSIQVMSFTANSYVLPEAKACPNYNFSGYYVNGNKTNVFFEGDTIPITGDTDIEAYYTFNGDANCAVNATALENGRGFNDSVAYNTRIELVGGDGAYGWIEEVGAGQFRPFAIGSNISLLASESVTLRAVTEAQFAEYGFKLPAINMRKDGVITNGTKIVFNGQIVEEKQQIREYGVIIGVLKNGTEIDKDKITVENAGTHTDYDVIRAKSTRLVGANQFVISVNGLAGTNFVYRGYLIYEKTNGEFVTIYS